ncbi:hypothetical protein FC696_12730 [Bacillus wiedmannii]|uniref:metallophosphoesterase n=1 Tax=Bacillus wiedmannii TaxID=1890302 RepID=UPI0010BEEC80|nr:metallophosphoesterase [Bacillus wiedmannii]TKI12516.1 hypothetical protein FC696_12730 [Bacillus wiedmannii]
MLIFISDLHLMDGTAGADHLDSDAFQATFKDLSLHAKKAEAQNVKIILLGDIFDILRSEKWFEIDLEHRPWGNKPLEQPMIDILNNIILNNKKTLEIISGTLEVEDYKIKPEIVYIPGNHDKFCNMYESLRQIIINELSIDATSSNPFPNFYFDKEYEVFARHGHEWDGFNFEPCKPIKYTHYNQFSHADYLNTSIGDLIATEFATKLPKIVKDNLSNYPNQEQIYNNFRRLFDVRPFAAMIPWIFYQTKKYDKSIQEIINSSIRNTTREFKKIPYVQNWIKEHNHWWHPFDKTNYLQLLLVLLESCEVTDFKQGMEISDKMINLWDKDKFALKALSELHALDSDSNLQNQISYILYGHTHKPYLKGLENINNSNEQKEAAYINTGTWRPTYHQNLIKNGFMSKKNITFTIIYKPGEKASGKLIENKPVFETWTGSYLTN